MLQSGESLKTIEGKSLGTSFCSFFPALRRKSPNHAYGGAQKDNQDNIDIIHIIGHKGRSHNQDGYPLPVFYNAAAHLPDHLGNDSAHSGLHSV